MKLIFCIDDNNGIMFFGKRQTKDRALRQWILNHARGKELYMSNYSARQFDISDPITANDNYMDIAKDEDICFVEDMPFSTEKVNEIILCKWNRKYPADRFLDIDLKKEGFKKYSCDEIVGYSHEKITIETYRRELK